MEIKHLIFCLKSRQTVGACGKQRRIFPGAQFSPELSTDSVDSFDLATQG